MLMRDKTRRWLACDMCTRPGPRRSLAKDALDLRSDAADAGWVQRIVRRMRRDYCPVCKHRALARIAYDAWKERHAAAR